MTCFRVFLCTLVCLLAACASKVLKYEKVDELKKNREFEQAVVIVPSPLTNPSPIEVPVITAEAPAPKLLTAASSKKEKSKKKIKTAPAVKEKIEEKPPARQPELEPSDGFIGRRPINDPLRVGEKVVHDVSFSTFNAGSMELSVDPFAVVNGRKSYQVKISIKTNGVFSTFYSVDDFVLTWIDFDQLFPHVFKLTVRETGQLREAQSLFDFEKKKATFWDKKVTEKEGENYRKVEWDIPEFSQNVYSSAFYLRFFQYEVGKEVAFRVANDNENLIFKAKVLRKEKLKTDVGEFDTIVIKPEIEIKGQYKPVGDIYMWLSDDDRKFILKIESKIKIGTMTSKIVELVKGTQ